MSGLCGRYSVPLIAWCFLVVGVVTWTPSLVSLPENSLYPAPVASISINSLSSNIRLDSFSVTPSGPFQMAPLSLTGMTYVAQVILNGPLDYESLRLYTLNVTAHDADAIPVSSSILVNVTDINEAPTCNGVFSTPGDFTRVREDEPANSIIYQVPATDEDIGDKLTFTILSVVPASGATRLQFNALTGVIMVPSTGFDYEVDKNYFLHIFVNDSKGLSCNGTVSITIMDSKDEPPGITGPSPTTIAIFEEQPQNSLVTTVTANDTNVYFELVSPVDGFYIESATGMLRTAYQLDVDNKPSLSSNNIVVRVVNYLTKLSATISLTVLVADINDNPPICTSYQHIYQIPEDTAVNTIITTLSCSDHDFTSPNNVLTYNMIPDANARLLFAQTNSTLKILLPLDYDSFALQNAGFQYTLIINVQDGAPTGALTATVKVMVVLTPVNEFNPYCNLGQAFGISEASPVGALVGAPACSDLDYPINSLRYSIISGNTGTPPPFYINPKTGTIHVLNTLDREKISNYPMVVQVVDLNNDIAADPLKQRTSTVQFSIFVTNVNDEPPVCTPAFYETTIYSTLAALQNVVQLQCTDLDSSAIDLDYKIIGGNTNSRFALSNTRPPSVLTLSTFSYFTLGGITDPKDFQLLVLVQDEALNPDKTRRMSSTATILIHVVPWTTTVPTAPTVFTTTILTVIDTYWKPDIWFIVVMVITGIMLLLIIALISYHCWKRMPCCWKWCKPSPPVEKEPLLEPNKITEPNTAPQEPIKPNEPKEAHLPSNGTFDGRAQDPITGKEYVFNSATGERSWV